MDTSTETNDVDVNTSIPPQIRTIIEGIIQAETGGDPRGGFTNDPRDKGGRTIWGISERANPGEWVGGPPSRERAIHIYYDKYVVRPGFANIVNPELQAQLVDFGVTSGPALATQKIQALVGTDPDGHLGPISLAKINTHPEPIRLNNQLALERVKMMGRLVQKRPSDIKFLSGWLNRATSFFRF